MNLLLDTQVVIWAFCNDPFDRLLVAQAELERLTVVTRDERIGRYGVPVIQA